MANYTVSIDLFIEAEDELHVRDKFIELFEHSPLFDGSVQWLQKQPVLVEEPNNGC